VFSKKVAPTPHSEKSKGGRKARRTGGKKKALKRALIPGNSWEKKASHGKKEEQGGKTLRNSTELHKKNLFVKASMGKRERR